MKILNFIKNLFHTQDKPIMTIYGNCKQQNTISENKDKDIYPDYRNRFHDNSLDEIEYNFYNFSEDSSSLSGNDDYLYLV